MKRILIYYILPKLFFLGSSAVVGFFHYVDKEIPKWHLFVFIILTLLVVLDGVYYYTKTLQKSKNPGDNNE